METKIIRKAERKVVSEKRRRFRDTQVPGAGYSFPVTDFDVVELYSNNGNDSARENYLLCLSDPLRYIDEGIVEDYWNISVPALLQCVCSQTLELSSTYTNYCECGREYDFYGGLLDPHTNNCRICREGGDCNAGASQD